MGLNDRIAMLDAELDAAAADARVNRACRLVQGDETLGSAELIGASAKELSYLSDGERVEALAQVEAEIEGIQDQLNDRTMVDKAWRGRAYAALQVRRALRAKLLAVGRQHRSRPENVSASRLKRLERENEKLRAIMVQLRAVQRSVHGKPSSQDRLVAELHASLDEIFGGRADA